VFRFGMQFGNPVGLPVLFCLGAVVFGARKRFKPGQCAAGDGYRLVSKCARFSGLCAPSISESETPSNRWRRSSSFQDGPGQRLSFPGTAFLRGVLIAALVPNRVDLVFRRLQMERKPYPNEGEDDWRSWGWLMFNLRSNWARGRSRPRRV
jgi:hypothetical protein